MSDTATAGMTFPYAEPPAPGSTREIAPGLLWLRLALPFRLNHVNVYLIRDGKGWAVVDTGLGDVPTRQAWQALLAGPLAGERLTQLIVTHFHPDHLGLAGWLCEACSLPLSMPRTEYFRSLSLHTESVQRSAALYREFYQMHGLPGSDAEMVASFGHEYLRCTTGVPTSFRRLQHGERLQLGERSFKVITGGGHALEQAMLYCADERLFLSADQVIAGISPNVSVNAMEPGADPLGSYLDSLREVAETVANDVLVLPGHGLPFVGLHARTMALARHHEARIKQVEAACRLRPCSAAELIPVLFARKLDAHQTGFAFGEVLAHVNNMIGRGDLVSLTEAGVERYSSSCREKRLQ